MNPHLPAPERATGFRCSPALLKRIALGLGAYVALILYPAYLLLGWIQVGTMPGWGQLTAVAAASCLFALYAYSEMAKLALRRGDRH